MQLNHLTDSTLINDTILLAKKERHFSALVIKHLAEIDKRKAFAEYGCRSLFEFCTRILKFSESQTQRRIEAARLLKVVPQIAEKLQNGDINLTQLSTLSPLFKLSEQTAEEKLKLIEEAQGKSIRDVQKIVHEKSGNTKPAQEKLKQVNDTEATISIVVDEQTLEILKELKSRMLHEGVKNYSDMVRVICTQELKKRREKFALKRKVDGKKLDAGADKDKELALEIKATQKGAKESTNLQLDASVNENLGKKVEEQTCVSAQTKKAETSDPQKNKSTTRYVPRKIKRKIWERAQGLCEFVLRSPAKPLSIMVKNGGSVIDGQGRTVTKCGSAHGLEFHHIHPHSHQGKNSEGNLMLLCKQHHQRQGVLFFGKG